MKKILFLITICLFLTGCTVNYNLDITDNNFKETITGNVTKEEIKKEENSTDIGHYLYFLNSEQNVFYNNNDILYNKVTNNTDNGIDFEYEYTFNEDNFSNSRILNECFDNYNFKTEDNKYHIFLYGDFKCAYTEKTNIKITTDYKVTAHNAKKENKNTYTWTINENETEDLNLFITIDKSQKASNDFIHWNTLKTISLILLIILSTIAIVIGKKIFNN